MAANATTFQKGRQRTGGRARGTPNRRTRELKDAILAAAEAEGGDEGLTGYLRNLARNEPVAFAGLLGKLIPLMAVKHGEEPLQITRIELVAVSPDNRDNEQLFKDKSPDAFN